MLTLVLDHLPLEKLLEKVFIGDDQTPMNVFLDEVTKMVAERIDKHDLDVLPLWEPSNNHFVGENFSIPAPSSNQPQLLFHDLGKWPEKVKTLENKQYTYASPHVLHYIF